MKSCELFFNETGALKQDKSISLTLAKWKNKLNEKLKTAPKDFVKPELNLDNLLDNLQSKENLDYYSIQLDSIFMCLLETGSKNGEKPYREYIFNSRISE